MYRRTFAILISVLALAGVAAGCGGDDSEPLTKAEFIEQADAACKEANKEADEVFEAFFKEAEKATKTGNAPPGEEDEKALLQEGVIPAIEVQIETLEDLNPPEADEAKIDALVVELEKVAKEAETHPVGASAQPLPFEKASKLAEDYGFKHCGNQ